VQKEALIQAEEGVDQARGSLLPTLTGSYSLLNQPLPQSVTGAAISPTSQSTGRLTAVQPLFVGLRDFAALRQRNHQVGVQKEALFSAARQLYYETAQTFFNVLFAESDVRNTELEIEVNQKRLKELEQFFKIGRCQWTDVLTYQANLSSLQATLEALRGQVRSAREGLVYLTQWSRDVPLSQGPFSLPDPLPELSQFLSRLEQRPEVRVAQRTLEVSEEGVPIFWGQHLPTVQLMGNYFFARPGVLRDVHWDVQLNLSVPLFQGGIIQSQVRQAHSVARQSERLLSQSRRLAEQEIRSFYEVFRADRAGLQHLDRLVELSDKNAQTQQSYYRKGLVTNLDVFTAISQYQQSKRQRDRQRLQIQLDWIKLMAASGQVSQLSQLGFR
jgi:outer membrane protein